MTVHPPLEIRELVAVAKVANLRNFQLAAAEMNTTQPTLSRLIANTEAALGVPLFQRGWSGAEPTLEGELVGQHARTLLQLLAETEQELFVGRSRHPALSACLTVTDLKVVDAIIRTGGATPAARDLGRSQPAVSRVLNDLKARLALELFERRRGGLAPLPAAARMSELFALISGLFETIANQLEQHKGHFSGRIAIGTLPFSAENLIPSVFARIAERHPRVRLVLVPGTYFSLVENLRRGEIDGIVGVARSSTCPPDLIEEILLEERFTIVARHDHPVHNTLHGLADLAEETWLIPPHGSPVRAYFERLCRELQIAPRVQTNEIQFFTAVEQMLADGNALGMQSYSDTQLKRLRPELRVLDLALPDNKTAIALTTLANGGQGPIFAEFVRLLRTHVSDFA